MVKLALVQMNSTVGALTGNSERIIEFCRRAYLQGAHLVLTPELSLVGYPPEDLLLRPNFYLASHAALLGLAQKLAQFNDLQVIVGHPFESKTAQSSHYFNAASILMNGNIIATYCKQQLPNDAVFDELRYFDAGNQPLVFNCQGVQFGLAICEDAWSDSVPQQAKAAGAEMLLILNGSPFHIHKAQLRHQVMQQHVCAQGLPLAYVNLVGGQDELVFDGNSFMMAADGQIKAQLAHTLEDMQIVDIDVVSSDDNNRRVMPLLGQVAQTLSIEAQIYQILVLGVRDYISKNGFPGVLLGLSGGVDSALTLAIAVDALGAEKVHAVMMPSPYTADISLIDSREMVNILGVRYDEISINACFDAFKTSLTAQLSQFPIIANDTTEENIQARIRGTMLMALSNRSGALVLTTGNKSEMAVGYCTLYGDMAGGFAVIKDVAKTLVYRLCSYRNSLSAVIPERIITRAPSAELRPDQTDQDSLPPYEILDGIMQLYMEQNYSRERIVAAGYVQEEVDRITRLIKINEYKRRQSPVGIRITHRAFGRDWRYPITSKFND